MSGKHDKVINHMRASSGTNFTIYDDFNAKLQNNLNPKPLLEQVIGTNKKPEYNQLTLRARKNMKNQFLIHNQPWFS